MTTKRRTSTSLVDCLLHGHRWHATFEQGRLLCPVCGSRAYCPGCSPHTIQTLRHASQQGIRLLYCADCRERQSRAKEREEAL
jgi:hypothetical protein